MKRIWHKGPPPHVGWWNASAYRAPDSWCWWDGTQNLSADQLQALSDEVGSEQSLLVCCAAFHGVTAAEASERWPNLTLKKIPKMVLALLLLKITPKHNVTITLP